MGMREEEIRGNCIRTHSGIYIDVFNAKEEDILIEDIAHALSQEPRFGGHLPANFSVGEHSLDCCERATEFRLECLLHDATEAYIKDMPSPIKKRLPDYLILEAKLMRVIAKKFNLVYPFPEEVHRVDKLCMIEEYDGIMLGNNPRSIISPGEIEFEFMEVFYRLTKGVYAVA